MPREKVTFYFECPCCYRYTVMQGGVFNLFHQRTIACDHCNETHRIDITPVGLAGRDCTDRNHDLIDGLAAGMDAPVDLMGQTTFLLAEDRRTSDEDRKAMSLKLAEVMKEVERLRLASIERQRAYDDIASRLTELQSEPHT